MKCGPNALSLVALTLSSLLFARESRGQQPQLISKDDQYRISEILRDARDEVKKHYYDPRMHGVDWDARYQHYAAMIPRVHNLGQGFEVVAAYLRELNDSHVFFVPPKRVNRYEDGYRFALVGNDCFITQIRPKSDAESKLHIGDQILTLDGYNVNRDDFHDLAYFLRALSPMPAAKLVVRSPGEPARSVIVNHTVKPGKPEMDLTNSTDSFNLGVREPNEDRSTEAKIVELVDVAIWKLPRFDLDFTQVDRLIRIARGHKSLILDLRGNPGGNVETLKAILGSLFDKDLKIADQVERKATKEMIAKRQSNQFTGKLIVLVDAGSASASELLARVVQLEHRGIVLGDKSAGAVMESKIFGDSRGTDVKFFYGFSVTDANLIMADGKSLEKTGVTPDELILPTGAQLAAGQDPVLARALELAGAKLYGVEASKLFPFRWAPL